LGGWRRENWSRAAFSAQGEKEMEKWWIGVGKEGVLYRIMGLIVEGRKKNAEKGNGARSIREYARSGDLHTFIKGKSFSRNKKPNFADSRSKRWGP